MKQKWNKLGATLLCASLLAGQAVRADDRQGDDPALQTESRKASEMLDRTASFLAAAKRFSLTMQTQYDAVQASGEKIEFGDIREIVIDRPGRFRSDHRQSDGDSGLLLFDGKSLTVFNATHNVYTRLELPGSVDDTIYHTVGRLGMRLPLAMLFVTRLPEELKRRVTSVDYVEKNSLTEPPTDHIAARTEDVDFQVWIDSGEKPVPRRVVISYKHAEGQPQFRAEFSNWNFSPELSDELFRFTPPADAEQIPILTPVSGTGGAR